MFVPFLCNCSEAFWKQVFHRMNEHTHVFLFPFILDFCFTRCFTLSQLLPSTFLCLFFSVLNAAIYCVSLFKSIKRHSSSRWWLWSGKLTHPHFTHISVYRRFHFSHSDSKCAQHLCGVIFEKRWRRTEYLYTSNIYLFFHVRNNAYKLNFLHTYV